MKLINCYVENFGKLCMANFDFNDGLNTIVRDNGEGKTTLSVFIKAMFYGLNPTRSSNLDENERKRFLPWQGGNFGGNLTFEVGGKQYRIERFFGKKENEDTFKLIDLKTGKESKAYSQNIGVEIFNLDADAYERCTYVPQKELSGKHESLTARLSAAIQGSDSGDRMDKANVIIDKRVAEIENKQHNGLLPNVNREIEEIKQNIDEIKQSIPIIDKLQAENANFAISCGEYEEQIEKIKLQINEYSKVKEALSKFEGHKKLVEELNSNLDKRKKDVLDAEKVLSGNEVTCEEVQQKIEETRRLSKLKSQKEVTEAALGGQRKAELEKYFKGQVPTANQLDDAKQKISKRFNYGVIPCIIGCCLCLLGIFLIKTSEIISIILSSAGAIGGITGIILTLMFYKKWKKGGKEDAIKFIRRYDSDTNLEEALQNIRLNLREYENLCEKQSEGQENLLKLQEDIEKLENSINQFLSKFETESEDVQQNLNAIYNAVQSLPKLRAEVDELTQKIEEANSSRPSAVDKEKIKDLDIDKLQNEESIKQDELDSVKVKIERNKTAIQNHNSRLEQLDLYEENLHNLEKTKEKLEDEKKLLGQAKIFLAKANEELKSKYLSPLKTQFDNYINSLVGDNNYDIDTSLKVSTSEFGMSHDASHLSKGYQTTIDLCVRFALLDVLFKKEKPFIILDDPLVNMDEKKIENTLKALKILSKNHQIIYLVCHKSRT